LCILIRFPPGPLHNRGCRRCSAEPVARLVTTKRISRPSVLASIHAQARRAFAQDSARQPFIGNAVEGQEPFCRPRAKLLMRNAHGVKRLAENSFRISTSRQSTNLGARSSNLFGRATSECDIDAKRRRSCARIADARGRTFRFGPRRDQLTRQLKPHFFRLGLISTSAEMSRRRTGRPASAVVFTP
jgi:hypothetical protein